MVTAGTLHKRHLFGSNQKLRLLQETILTASEDYGWDVQAWAVFSNHYHLIALAPQDGKDVRSLVQRVHSQTSRELNKIDSAPGRQVWFQYWDTCLTYESSYYARLNYVHNNPVHHEMVPVATQYRYCSAGWFEQRSTPGFYGKVCSYPYDRVTVRDDF
jgi:putative transposase